MSVSDILFRAFAEYRKTTQTNRDCERRVKEIARTGAASDCLETVRTECVIENDWIDAIEEGLVHIGKAIAQERQFIRSNGEVVDIEKVKNVSRESVEHLAKHSNLLTKEPKGEELIPDRLYTVERLTDYAVYENRFLYMLLCYLRDFLSWRYTRILELTQTYEGQLSLDKTIEKGGRKTIFRLYIEEERKFDPFLSETSGCREQLERIDGLIRTVEMYLATPLMEFVAKAPKLKPPVTETNVLKMNKEFKAAVQLYYFITAYEKDGFTAKQEKVSLTPLEEKTAQEFAEAAELFSFLAYKANTGQQDILQSRLVQELEREKREAQQKEQSKLQALKKRIAETGTGMDEYLLLLEKHAQELEVQCSALPGLRKRLERSEKERTEAISAHKESERLLFERETEYRAEKENLCKGYEARLQAEAERAQAETLRLNAAHEEEMRKKQEECAKEIASVQESCSLTVQEIRSQSKKEKEEADAKLERALKEKSSAEKELSSCRAESARLQQEKTLAQAQLISMKKDCGALTEKDDFTGREQFDELEHQYRVFRSFFREEWKKAKKRIRKEVFESECGEKNKEERNKDKDGE